MKTISVINYKGGVGKTTVTANLAAELAFRGRSVLMIDLDPQASLTFSFVRPDYWSKSLSDGKTIKKWYDGSAMGGVGLSDLITPLNLRVSGKLHLIPSHLGLINVDLELATELGGGTLAQTKRNYLKVHSRLRDGLSALAPDAYDYVIIDCPPNFNVVTKTAIVASDWILVPAKPDYLSTLGIDYLRRNVNELVRDYNDYIQLDTNLSPIAPEILGVLFTMVTFYRDEPISTMRPFIRQASELGLPVFAAKVRENKSIFSEAAQINRPVVLTRYNNQSHAQVVSELEALVNEFERKVGHE